MYNEDNIGAPEVKPHPLSLDELVHHTEYPATRLSTFIDSVIKIIGNAMSWVWVVLMLVIIGNVLMRYVFNQGRIEFEEIQWHLYSIGWLVGLSYCLVADDHVRVDLIHDRLSLKAQAVIEFFGILFLLMPFVIVVLWYSIPFILYSWSLGEVSDAPGGLAYRWLIKSVLFIGFALLSLATLSRLYRVSQFLLQRSDTNATPPSTKKPS
ncbi:TRAP transporter small permease subunit [Neptunomonas antarctica]|uniref:TRAP transporter small permease protein n=1 Tax=Neptunomonas antarctica TaxID=619304 RepID=A0A1N7PFI8_9GAMM|nr:TRAP transporter small permease subunit [Neptunomonas antarctica]SIT09119.1 TRAP-type mannitol/chloroaromatic compound transport system, small permease component [Neptunomonas antarctica]